MERNKTLLEPSEERFLHRQLRNGKNYLYFSIIGVTAAIGLLVYYFAAGKMDGAHFALIIMILVGARGNLKQHKDARLLSKFYKAEKQEGEGVEK